MKKRDEGVGEGVQKLLFVWSQLEPDGHGKMCREHEMEDLRSMYGRKIWTHRKHTHTHTLTDSPANSESPELQPSVFTKAN